jgi:hypothetical protein
VDIEALADLTEVQYLIQGMRYPDPSQPTMMISSTITMEGFVNMVKHSCERIPPLPPPDNMMDTTAPSYVIQTYLDTLLTWQISVSNGANPCDVGKKSPTP